MNILEVQGYHVTTTAEHVTFHRGNLSEFSEVSYELTVDWSKNTATWFKILVPIQFEPLSSFTMSATSTITSVETGFRPLPRRTIPYPQIS